MNGIFFHYFTDENNINCQGALNGRQFERILLYILSHYNVCDPIQFTNDVLNDRVDKNEVCLCFNCGLKSQVEVALPILEKYNIKAFWMLCSKNFEEKLVDIEVYHHFRFFSFNSLDEFYKEFFNLANLYLEKKRMNLSEVGQKMISDNYLSWSGYYSYDDKLYRYLRDYILSKEYNLIMEELMFRKKYNPYYYFDRLWVSRADVETILNKGNVIGLHSHSHPDRLELLDFDKQLMEYEKNKKILESITGCSINSMSHPSNSYNENTLFILKKLGIKIGFQSKCNNTKSSLLIPTIDHSLFMKK